ncbi:hypothetical protein Lsed01_00387 [Demequina sediminis]|uniref:GmrSD restriction endonucleases N-terminal domain-containing protein n=1 Tax=Demequina sediminis TaxID=1930058 RepID=A0ABP9WDS7_9MICO|nr:DUF262 domain-containing protein [Demequina sediminis]BDZ61086.1 hypothetical protein GCM10025873_08770 [Demequina sediminis]
MKGEIASYSGLFRDSGISRIEIPLIQRDYAQGREGVAVRDIRDGFLEVLANAVECGVPVSLDFIYGDFADGVFRPLDGQQRLTTLFLIHWYAACRTGELEHRGTWANFNYATRPSARTFCERLTDPTAMASGEPSSRWLMDQPWFAFDWRHDPTIKAMLVMIDAIAERFDAIDPHLIWERLTREDGPVVSFHTLQINEARQGDDLYIKMNSRGKPLTPFENFKARFEGTIAHTGERAKEFARKVDVDWSDMLWPHRGDDDIVDDEFMRYLGFLIEVCEWRDGTVTSGPLGPRAYALFGPEAPRWETHLTFVFDAFDTWLGAEIPDYFGEVFTTAAAAPSNDQTEPTAIPLFGRGAQSDLFTACCRDYGELWHSKARAFSLQQGILLYAVLMHRIGHTDEPMARLRALRNIVEWSGDEIRLADMPAILNDVDRLMIDGDLQSISTLNQAQVADEIAKAEFLASNPHLEGVIHRLEDHDMLRGALTSFDLDDARLAARAAAFDAVFSHEGHWADASAALLTFGEYQRTVPRSTKSLFGTAAMGQTQFWRDLLAGGQRDRIASTRDALMQLLDAVAESDVAPTVTMRDIRAAWLADREEARCFDWRYYFARYPSMRSGDSGIYVRHSEDIGYNVRMLIKTQLNSWYRDPYLLTLWEESGRPDKIEDPWYRGSEPERWFKFRRKSAEVRCVDDGWAVRLRSAGQKSGPRFLQIMESLGWVQVGPYEGLIPVTQREVGGQMVDSVDRITVGREIVGRLLADGF